jgi:hypothetical protein
MVKLEDKFKVREPMPLFACRMLFSPGLCVAELCRFVTYKVPKDIDNDECDRTADYF